MSKSTSIQHEEKVRTHIIIPKGIMKQLDKLVGARGRSKFIIGAVVERINRIRLAHAAKKVAGSLRNTAIPEWDTSEKASEWVHSLRRDADTQRGYTKSP